MPPLQPRIVGQHSLKRMFLSLSACQKNMKEQSKGRGKSDASTQSLLFCSDLQRCLMQHISAYSEILYSHTYAQQAEIFHQRFMSDLFVSAAAQRKE